MESQLRELMQDLVGDPPHHVTAQAVRRQMARRRLFTVIAAAAVVALIGAVVPAIAAAFRGSGLVAAGGPARSYLTRLPDGRGSIYHDAAGWTIHVPPGWHVIGFHSSKAGVTAAGAQVSNTSLPAPKIMPGFAIQAGETLPAHGVALVIATDNDPRVCRPGPHPSPAGGVTYCQRSYASLPISFKNLILGSSPAGAPVTGSLWVRAGGKALSLTAKFGSKAFSQRSVNAVSKVIGSLTAVTASPRPAVAEPGQPVPAAAVHRLAALADRAVTLNGGHPVTWATAVVTTHAKALTSATPGDTTPDRNTVVYLVTIKGHFVCDRCSWPPGGHAPTGTYLSLVIDARTFAETDFGIGHKPPPVPPARFGPVTNLKVHPQARR